MAYYDVFKIRVSDDKSDTRYWVTLGDGREGFGDTIEHAVDDVQPHVARDADPEEAE